MPLMEQKIVRLDGQAIDIEATAAPVTYEGKPAVQSVMRDITERKRQEDRFRLLAEATNDVIWDADLTPVPCGGTTITKAVWLPEAEADARLSWYGRMHPEDAARVATTMQQAEDNGQRQWLAEYRFRRADGEYADVLDRAYIIHDSAGKAIRAIGSMVDVTALKKTRAELALAEERFRLVAKATNDFVYDWNMPDDAMWWNEQFRDQFGYREADLQPGSTAWTDRLHPDDRTRVWEGLHEAFREGHTQTSFEYRFRKPDGTYAYILERGYILYNGMGLPVRMVGSMADLSPLRKAQEELEEKASTLQQFNAELVESGAALRESLSKFQAVFDSNMIGIFFWNLGGAVMEANDEFLAATGYSRQDLESGRAQLGAAYARRPPPGRRQGPGRNQADGGERSLRKGILPQGRQPGARHRRRRPARRLLQPGHWLFAQHFRTQKGRPAVAAHAGRTQKAQLRTRHVRLQGVARPAGPAGFHPGAHQHPQGGAGPGTVHHYIALMENRAGKLDVFIQSILAHSRTNSTEVQVGPGVLRQDHPGVVRRPPVPAPLREGKADREAGRRGKVLQRRTEGVHRPQKLPFQRHQVQQPARGRVVRGFLHPHHAHRSDHCHPRQRHRH
jgi:PAS domain S-box-containing protein